MIEVKLNFLMWKELFKSNLSASWENYCKIKCIEITFDDYCKKFYNGTLVGIKQLEYYNKLK